MLSIPPPPSLLGHVRCCCGRFVLVSRGVLGNIVKNLLQGDHERPWAASLAVAQVATELRSLTSRLDLIDEIKLQRCLFLHLRQFCGWKSRRGCRKCRRERLGHGDPGQVSS